jgi:hypothetical protein
MRLRVSTAILGIAAAALIPDVPAGQASDPIAGTWEMIPAKSTFNPGPASRSETRTYEVLGTSVRLTSVVVDADGTSRTVKSSYTVDGKVYPVAGAADVDGQSLTQVDRFTVDVNMLKNGKVVRTATRTVSKDGKTLTIWFRGTDATGRTFDNRLVFERR